MPTSMAINQLSSHINTFWARLKDYLVNIKLTYDWIRFAWSAYQTTAHLSFKNILCVIYITIKII